MARLEWGELFSMDVPDGWEVSEYEPMQILFTAGDAAIHISWLWPPGPLPVGELETHATEAVDRFAHGQTDTAIVGYTTFAGDDATGVWADLDPTADGGQAWGVGCWAWVDALMVLSWVGPSSLSDQRETALLMFGGVERLPGTADPE